MPSCRFLRMDSPLASFLPDGFAIHRLVDLASLTQGVMSGPVTGPITYGSAAC